MSRICLLALLFVSLASPACFGGKDKDKFDEWRPIEPWEQQIKDVPGNSGAPAIQLYYGLTRDDIAQFAFVYRRIKVLNEKGKGQEYANVEIEIGPEVQLTDLKARTIHPDGKIIEFDGRVLDKTIVKTRGLKVLGKAFGFPDVTVGSILEYKYRLTWKGRFVYDSIWSLQHSLFTSREEFRFKPYEGPLATRDGGGGRVSMAYLNQLNELVPQKRGDFWRMDLENVPGLLDEEYAPPDDEYKPLVYFYYGGREIASPEQFWSEMSKLWTERSERFIGNSREIQDAATAAIAGETDPEKKLRKLYARAQQLRNLSFERQRTQEEEKREGLKPAETAAEVLKRQYGTQAEINRLFVALARAAGFEASVMRVPSRQDSTFNKNILFWRQLNTEIAGVESNGKMIFLDPGTRFCPYRLLRWMNTAVPALRTGKAGGGFVDIPAALATDAVVSRISEFFLNSDGLLKGDLTIEFKGEEALERRLDALNTDDAGRKKALEDEISQVLPAEATVKLKDVQGWSDQEQPLVAKFSLEIPSFAAAAGKRLVAPAFFFQSVPKRVFASSSRRSPVVFRYGFSETDTIKLKLPKDYVLEHPPHERKNRLYDASYEIRNSLSGDQLVITRSLSLNGMRFGVERFGEMKDFFAVVQAGDESQAIMQFQPVTVQQ